MADFSHFNEEGRAKMVDVGGKDTTIRTAVAAGRVLVNKECFDLIKSGGMKKGDVLGTAQVAGIMGAKSTSQIIPMCHPIMINGANITFSLNEEDLAIEIMSEVKCSGVTGVEMEALSAVSIAALTIYDMCKAVQKDMVIDRIHLLRKTGGKSGDFRWEDR
ncbi:MAG: cyclic pyranopterin monophosphate synthase MoaC [Clostridiales Family XIII bacterium]|uniref:cyclic pyranopterin monophosphate synthase MoaC n=1 Tax=Hominibacterium faecale TaxID=2839743 RepID=UPI0022B29689|nr:cyclic pyranopterin monophosphate synthase MoaC [Hominibacterium faecale]MCI7302234.1 cyclic pyranopterin monophosphate synthase MoaC [Clostridia bacterium]MDE8734516.1 cyclic pyranopterin monophosphate synthase MoaC [Eubacteriales bacterium DFI.9.88]MDY3009700.1 cyclic pyranopterin monophosphate synthase MoaC [Clostridiales Family XIII bacterium]